ncbi:MAG: hypothetical protein K8S98_19000 [Planctomycetes bacterium]|nr:hypothetical protein [Planctomycetota bacterium]
MLFLAPFVAAFLALAPSTETPQPLAWADLVDQPEHWPITAQLVKELRYRSGVVLAPGTVLHLVEVRAANALTMAPAGQLVTVEPSDCDLVDAANAYAATLTPEQRAMTYESVARDVTLWPMTVTTYAPIDSADGHFPIGAEFQLVRSNGRRLSVVGAKAAFTLEATRCDFLPRARELAALPESRRPGRLPALLAGAAVDLQGKTVELPLVKYYVFYGCASTCMRSSTYTPTFVERYKRTLAKRNDVVVLTLTDNFAVRDAIKYARDTGMTWPIVPLDRRRQELNDYHVALTPGMAVVDRFGRLLSTNAPGFRDLDRANAVLDKLELLLAKDDATAK